VSASFFYVIYGLPVVGGIVLIDFYALAGHPVPNRYGPLPDRCRSDEPRYE
jgi:hypothetical protein